MLVRQIVAALVVALVASSAAAQQPQRSYGETLEIRVINIDAVVTDRSGNPVTGLTRDDFELFENGKRKEVSNFLEVNERAAAAAGTPPAQTERRHLIVFVDNTSLQPFNRDRVLNAMKAFIEATMRTGVDGAFIGDEAIVASWNPGLKENLALTTDRARVLAALQSMIATTGLGTMLRAERERVQNELRQMPGDYQSSTAIKSGGLAPAPEPEPGSTRPGSPSNIVRVDEKPPYDRALGAVRQYADSVMLDTKQKADALKTLMLAFRGVQGRKALILVTESFSTQPARQMFEYLDSIKDQFDRGNFQNPRAEIMRYNDDPLFQTVTSTANAAGITLYAVSAGGVTSGSDFSDASDRGSTAQQQTVAGKAPGKFADQSLQELAAATGGLAVTGSNDFARGFERIASDLTMYYSLGYRADSPANDMIRKVEVKVKKPGVVVRYRESFVQKATPTEIGDTLAANLFAGVQKNDLGITISAGTATPKNEGEITVPVTITVPIAALTFVPDGKDVVGKFTIFAGFTRKDGSSSKISKIEYPLRFLADSMQDQRNLNVKINMTMQKTTENISVAVLDQTSNATGYATVKLP